LQSLAREAAQAAQQAEAHLPVTGRRSGQQALVQEIFHRVDHLGAKVVCRHGFGAVERERAREDAEVRERALLGWRQQAEAPFEGPAQ
jgi:hypothetical protein